MSLIIATGSNLGDKKKNLLLAKNALCEILQFTAESRIYQSPAVEYLNQNDFFNQVLEFKIPEHLTPSQMMETILEIEKNLGRDRKIPKGPRTVDIDIIFWGTDSITTDNVIIPHPSCLQRSFVIKPMQELPYFETLEKYFTIPSVFSNKADPI